MTTVQTPTAVDATYLDELCLQLASDAKQASRRLPMVATQSKNDFLLAAADALIACQQRILTANERDLKNAPMYGLSPAAIDRLKLTEERIADIAAGLRGIAGLPDPIGEVLESFRRPNNLLISKVRVPLGVVFFIYESRPNVTADAAAICLKSGNAVLLRGGKEALHSSREIVIIMQEQLEKFGLPKNSIQLVPVTDRQVVGNLLAMRNLIDVAIPRGGKELIQRVMDEATMPVIKHFDGNCHVYVDAKADLEMALDIVENSKCQRMGVCNAMESLLVHQSISAEFLPQLQKRLRPYAIVYHADGHASMHLVNAKAATAADWSTEYLGPEMSVKVVADVATAIEHVNRYGSGHTDCIVSNDYAAVEQFLSEVDSSAVLVNASTRFNDGGEFGFGAEIGISTDKFHARGPCGLRELTSYKYVVRGDGQIRS